jgi:hypothetical protein
LQHSNADYKSALRTPRTRESGVNENRVHCAFIYSTTA